MTRDNLNNNNSNFNNYTEGRVDIDTNTFNKGRGTSF